MGSGYETELSLRLGSGHHGSWADSDSSATSRSGGWFGNTQQNHHHQQQQQQQQIITMFYNGQMCVCDVTEIQARAIISMAKREMEEKMENKNQQRKEYYYSSPPQTPSTSSSSPSPSPPALAPQLLNPGLSMKRSLQRFLQKRKTRVDGVSPYGRTAQWQSS